MVDWPSRLHLPAFLWNVGMVLHVLKSDPALRELEHVQVDGPSLAYLLFYDRHGQQGLMKEATLAICSHLADAFAEWIERSTHFKVVPLQLEEGCSCTVVAQERCRQHIWTQEPSLSTHAAGTASSGSSLQLVGRAPPVPEWQDGAAEQEMPRASVERLHQHPMKARLMPGGGGGGSPLSSPEHPGGEESDDYSTASESGWGHGHRRHWQAERRLAPARLKLSVFCSTDANADVIYEIWWLWCAGMAGLVWQNKHAPPYFW